MSTQSSNHDTLVNALAALAGVAAAVLVKLVLSDDESGSRASAQPVAPTPRDQQLALMRRAAYDPQYLADMQAANNDFAFTDAELL